MEETRSRKAARPSQEPGRRRLLPAMRQAAMLSLLAERGMVSAADLTALLGVSLMTVHRDLNALERRGLVLKTFGGAIATSYHQAAYFHFTEQMQLRQAQKIAIAERAVTLVLLGDTIVIDGSTTGYWFAKRLTRAVANWGGSTQLTVVTNSVPLLTELASAPRITLFSTGGMLDRNGQYLYGPAALRFLAELRADKLFFSAAGVLPEEGVADVEMNPVQVKRLMLRASRERYLLVDSSKFGARGLVPLAPLSELTALITDSQVSLEVLQALATAGLEGRIIVAAEGEAAPPAWSAALSPFSGTRPG